MVDFAAQTFNINPDEGIDNPPTLGKIMIQQPGRAGDPSRSFLPHLLVTFNSIEQYHDWLTICVVTKKSSYGMHPTRQALILHKPIRDDFSYLDPTAVILHRVDIRQLHLDTNLFVADPEQCLTEHN